MASAFLSRQATARRWLTRLLELIEDEALRRRLGAAMRARIESMFAIDRVAAIYEQAYELILSGRCQQIGQLNSAPVQPKRNRRQPMCGIAGLALMPGVSTASVLDAVRRMTARMHARGPDAEGEWAGDGVVLGHRRLAIVDLDARANQPMASADGRYLIVFNGEIYNFRELRRELEADGVAFRTTSDTEVLLALFAREGERMLPRLRGMFAFAIWDTQTTGTVPRARSVWHQAALLCADRPRADLCLPSQGAARVGIGFHGTGAGGIGGFLSLGQRTRAMDAFPRHVCAACRPLVAGARRSDGERRCPGTTSVLTGKGKDARHQRRKCGNGCGRR